MRSSPSAYLDNLRKPMPSGRKLRLLVQNILRRARIPPTSCCGHPGEPGC